MLSDAVPGVFAGSCMTRALLQHDAWSVAPIDAAGESMSIVLIVLFVPRLGLRLLLDRYQDALILVAAVALGRVVIGTSNISCSIAAVWLDILPLPRCLAAVGVGCSGERLVVHPASMAFALRWWANSTVGVVLVVPLLAFRPAREPAPRQELGAWGLYRGWLVAAVTLPGLAPRFSAGALALAAVAALRFGVAGSVGTLVFSMCAGGRLRPATRNVRGYWGPRRSCGASSG